MIRLKILDALESGLPHRYVQTNSDGFRFVERSAIEREIRQKMKGLSDADVMWKLNNLVNAHNKLNGGRYVKINQRTVIEDDKEEVQTQLVRRGRRMEILLYDHTRVGSYAGAYQSQVYHSHVDEAEKTDEFMTEKRLPYVDSDDDIKKLDFKDED